MANNNDNSRVKRAAITKANLVKNAFKLIEKKGYENVSIREICAKSNVSIGVFYYYFESKSQIFEEMFDKLDGKLLKRYDQLKSETAANQLVGILTYYAKSNNDTGVSTIRVLYTPDTELYNEKGAIFGVVLDIIEKGTEKGEFVSERTPNELAYFVMIAARGVVYDWCRHNGNYDLSRMMYEYICELIKLISGDACVFGYEQLYPNPGTNGTK